MLTGVVNMTTVSPSWRSCTSVILAPGGIGRSAGTSDGQVAAVGSGASQVGATATGPAAVAAGVGAAAGASLPPQAVSRARQPAASRAPGRGTSRAYVRALRWHDARVRTSARWIVLALVLLLGVSLAWTAVALVQARGDLDAAAELLEGVRDTADPGTADPVLAEAQGLLEQATGRLRQPGPRLVSLLPGLGRTVVAARATADAGAAVVAGGREVLAAVPDQLLSGGQLDLAGLSRVENALRSAEARTRGPVERLAQLELAGTPGSVSAGVRRAQHELGDTPAALDRGADGLRALRGVLGEERERRLLIVLQNNAELRATGGLISVFTEATARDGRLQLEAFQEVEEVADEVGQAQQVPTPPGYDQLFAPFRAGTTLWKNVNMAADVPTSSSVLAEVAELSLTQPPEVVVWVDVPAIAAVLRATGPVSLPDGSTLSADNTVPRLLSDAYRQVEDTSTGQEQRRDDLRAAADAVLGQLLAGRAGTSATDLARELAPAAAGRHLALWSDDSEEQELLESARLSGAVRARNDLAAFAVHNLGDGIDFGNKLDYYSRRQVTVRVEVHRDEAVVEQEVALRNTAPGSGLPVYVSGRAQPGVANVFVTLAVPSEALIESFVRDDRGLTPQPSPLGDHGVLTDAASLPPGTTTTWRVRYRLPLVDGHYTSQLFPQPLAVDAGLLLEVRAAAGLVFDGGDVTVSGPYDRLHSVDVVAEPPTWLSRARSALRTFWNEPVQAPW